LSDSRITCGTVGLVTTGLPSAASVGASIAASKATRALRVEGNLDADRSAKGSTHTGVTGKSRSDAADDDGRAAAC
jgi:hypothetical protein